MSNTIFVDNKGISFKYTCSYEYEERKYSFTIWAENFSDAEARMKAIAENGTIDGKILLEISE